MAAISAAVRQGSRLNQIRFRRRNAQHDELKDFRLSDRAIRDLHARAPLVDGDPAVRHGLVLHIELGGMGPDGLVGYRAQRHTDIIDLDRAGAYAVEDYWEPIRARADKRLILDPNEFYILASKERLHIPAGFAAEMVPIDPMMGEFRVHYAGFFDPGFGATPNGRPGSRGVLEVRSHEVPVVLEDGAFAVGWGAAVQFFPESDWKRQVDTMAAVRNSKVAMLSHTQLAKGEAGTDNYGKPVT